MKKIFSLLLVFTMLLTMCMPCFAANETSYNGNPIIIVRGIDVTLTYEDGSSPLRINKGKILGMLIECIGTHFALGDEDALYDAFVEITNDIIGPFACDENGDSVNAITKKQYPKALSNYSMNYYNDSEGGIIKSAVERYGAENVYFFAYDYRKTPIQLASELSTLIETAKADSGKNKVNIIAASMGCMVTNAYLYYENGYSNIDRALYLSGAHNGLESVGDALCGNISFDKKVIKDTICNLMGDNIFVNLLLQVFDALGAFDYLTDYFNNWVEKYFESANDDVLRDCLGTMPGIWTFCPDEYFDTAYNTIFGGHEDEYPVCQKIKEVGNFNKQTENIIAKAYQSGIKISFVSHYNTPSIPVYDNSRMNSDGVIETSRTSNFATVALYGETLSDEYINSVSNENKKYISPDKVIDASTALYKDYTWFVKDAAHVACNYGTQMNDFIFVLLENENQPTVSTVAGYSQFLDVDENMNFENLK